MLAELRAEEHRATEEGPLSEVELAVLEMSEQSRIAAKHSECKRCSDTDCKPNIGPAALSREQIFLAQQMGLWSIDDLVGSIISRVALLIAVDVPLADVVQLLSLIHI